MYRSEYPRPEFVRNQWENLNGTWDFQFGKDEWRDIEVPFAPQAKLSGIGDNRMEDYLSYRRSFSVSPEWKGKEIWLNFGAVDYECKVLVNGQVVGSHIGGNGAFGFNITEALLWNGEEVVTVEAYDPCDDETIPRGKQFWKPESAGIWYTRTSGIWQTVWLEPRDKQAFEYIRFTPDIDSGCVQIEYMLSSISKGAEAEFKISMGATTVYDGRIKAFDKHNVMEVSLFSQKIFRSEVHGDSWCWSPEHPSLFDVEAVLYEDGKITDQVTTYFGMRKIEIKDGAVYLNNRPYYQKLILDQGYWPDGLMTARDDSDFINDIRMSKEMGFNGCRKHQKAEAPRFLYHADRLGYLVWSEIGSCPIFSTEASQRLLTEWTELIKRDYNHPSIVSWVVLNESWGVPEIRTDKKQQAHALALYYNVHSMDSTRLVVANDGWEMVKSDICAIHNYSHGSKDELEKQRRFAKSLSTKEELLTSMPSGRQIYADGSDYQGEPILLTEFGGLSYSRDNEMGWGYTTIDSDEEFLETYERILTNINDSTALYGYCYTQLTDVEQEMNGLLTYDRQFKIAPEKIKKINDMVTKMRVY